MTKLTPKEMIAKLVSFDTTSRDSNLALIHWVQGYLAEYGIDSHLVPNEDGSKANLYASVGPAVEGGVVLSGHTDVVPVDGQPWDSDPFTLREGRGEEGGEGEGERRLFGRGTCDMKSFYAIALARLPQMLEAGLKRPIHFALSYDEETGCFGAPDLIEAILANLPRPRAVIVGEPTSMKVFTAQKGIASFVTEVIGHEAHSSQVHRGVSAVMVASRLVTWLEDRMHANAAKADPESPFEPPYTTITVGTINGGTAGNILARRCKFIWDCRTVLGEDPRHTLHDFEAHIAANVLPAMQAIEPACTITTTVSAIVPGLRPSDDNPAEELARLLTGDNAMHAAAYATEAGQFQEQGLATVICGPGSIDQAHQPNEFISLEQVEAGIAFTDKLIDHLRA